eukprot:UN13203
MGFLVGVFLIIGCNEITAFWLFEAIMMQKPYLYRNLYTRGFPGLKKLKFEFRSLLLQEFPELAEKMSEENVPSDLYLSDWYMKGFATHLPFDALLRVWDMFLCDGMVVFHKT